MNQLFNSLLKNKDFINGLSSGFLYLAGIVNLTGHPDYFVAILCFALGLCFTSLSIRKQSSGTTYTDWLQQAIQIITSIYDFIFPSGSWANVDQLALSQPITRSCLNCQWGNFRLEVDSGVMQIQGECSYYFEISNQHPPQLVQSEGLDELVIPFETFAKKCKKLNPQSDYSL
jgi:hypothetical protein